MKTTSEMSPLIETIEVSETLMRGGDGKSGMETHSEITATPSEWRNGKLF